MSWPLIFWIAVLILFLLDLIRRIRQLPKERRARVAFREMSFIAAFYVFTMVLLMFLENKFIYFPTTSSKDWQEPTGLKAIDIWHAVTLHGKQEKVHSWWCPVEKSKGVVLYFHGNAGNLSHRHWAIVDWQRQGYAVLIIDYPGYGRSSGSPDEAGCYAAGQAAYDWLTKEQQYSPQQIVLYGKSLGAAIAVELAMQNPHQALVLFAPFTSIPDMAQKTLPFFPARYMVRTQFDNLSKLKRYEGHLIIGHGETDSLVPMEMGKVLYALAKTNNKVWYAVPDTGHEAPPASFYAEVSKQLQRWQQKPSNVTKRGL